MTTINTTDDLLSLLNENHEFREAVRRAILTEELMSLPAVFSSFASEVRSDIKILKDGYNELRQGQQELNDKYQSLSDGQQELNDKYQSLSDGQQELNDKYQSLSDGQQELRQGQHRHTNDIGELKGIGLETKLFNRGPSLIATLLKVRRSERVRVAETDANSEEFNNVIYKAQDAGVIANDEYERLLNTDMIIRSARTGTPGPVYTAIESSYSVTREDIEKVSRTASILRKVFPEAEVHAALYYMVMSSFIETEAVRREVHLMKAGNIV
ncbi:MAG: hypothetical protein OXC95_12510 [Dehalococcoidia bacterium]|nr:hypothetical protein [Dehalococcoidia bacterium]